jgi:hypothetical protein
MWTFIWYVLLLKTMVLQHMFLQAGFTVHKPTCVHVFSGQTEKKNVQYLMFIISFTLNLFTHHSLYFNFELMWWRLFQKHVMCIKSDLYVFIILIFWTLSIIYPLPGGNLYICPQDNDSYSFTATSTYACNSYHCSRCEFYSCSPLPQIKGKLVPSRKKHINSIYKKICQIYTSI